MTNLQYHCILSLAEVKTLHTETKLCAKDAECAGNKITAYGKRMLSRVSPSVQFRRQSILCSHT